MKDVSHLKEEQFRRRTGVKPETFEKMLDILERASRGRRTKGGRPSALGLAKMLMMTLEVPQRVPHLLPSDKLRSLREHGLQEHKAGGGDAGQGRDVLAAREEGDCSRATRP